MLGMILHPHSNGGVKAIFPRGKSTLCFQGTRSMMGSAVLVMLQVVDVLSSIGHDLMDLISDWPITQKHHASGNVIRHCHDNHYHHLLSRFPQMQSSRPKSIPSSQCDNGSQDSFLALFILAFIPRENKKNIEKG